MRQFHFSRSCAVAMCLCAFNALTLAAEVSTNGTPNSLFVPDTLRRIGSGGYGYTRGLPGKDYDPARVKPHNMWSCSNAQIFSEVSTETHGEFAVKHDMRWLTRFGLTYYGCCEPLHRKMEVLRRIPNLPKVSVNYRCNLDRVASDIGPNYVWSYKPNPAVLAEDGWRSELARVEMVRVAEKAVSTGSRVEFIMKDVSTVRYHPERLWDWARIAMEVSAESLK